MSSDVTSAADGIKEAGKIGAMNGSSQGQGEDSSPGSPVPPGRVSPVTLKLKSLPDGAGGAGRVLEMVVEKVKAREGTVSPPAPVLGLEESKDVGRKRRASNDSEDSSMTKASESNTEEREEEEENEEDEERIGPGENIDPERLKAFNMFVRLFVDENLDRTVPISKQPKDKIQAILEACDRQFAEFHDRSRKRVRTYLKSCRRLKKSKDGGFEPVKQTPPHLTSAAAEQILAQACENESENAKRMRLGHEPLPAHLMTTASRHPDLPLPTPSGHSKQNSPSSHAPTQQPSDLPHTPQGSRSPNVEKVSRKRTAATPDFSRTQPPTPAKMPSYRAPASSEGGNAREPITMTMPFNLSNGIHRSGLPSSFASPPAHQQISLLQNSLSSSQVQNGPTDLSMKGIHHNNNNNASSPRKLQQLSPQEVATIQSLIAGYRESAAFLYRSAEELEQILQQQKQLRK